MTPAKIELWFSSRKDANAIAKISPKYLARSPVSILIATKFMGDPPHRASGAVRFRLGDRQPSRTRLGRQLGWARVDRQGAKRRRQTACDQPAKTNPKRVHRR